MQPSVRDTPTFAAILYELPYLSTKDIAKYLGVTERAVRNWKNAGEAPRAVTLALYWHTHYGRAFITQEAYREIADFYRRAVSAELEAERLRTVIRKLEQASAWPSSNTPVFKTL